MRPPDVSSGKLVVAPVDPQGPDAMLLLREAALEARALYPDLIAPDAPMPTNTPLQDRAAYFVAYIDSTSAGCAAFRPIDGKAAEVRRMFVLQSHRRHGIARALLVHLEKAATALHYSVLRLETGYRQAAAMALYESFGFRRIPPFGEYRDDPTSVCYEKPL
jgi:putative acetyltransferase